MVVLGPTASGKTSLAIALAHALQTEVISCDSRQFYTELSIGVARPSPAELASVAHHFISFLSVREDFSSGKYGALARPLMIRLLEEKGAVVIAGGSGLYLDALLNGLDELPGDQKVRERLHAQFSELGIAFLQQQLLSLDPEYYAQVDLQNPHRVMRALEVIAITGRPYSAQRTGQVASQFPFRIVKIGLQAEREWLYPRINARVDQMVASGLEEEARSVMPFRDRPALNTVGYKEWFAHFDGLLSRDESIEKIKQHTRNYAKRQQTWWRRDSDIQWIDASSTDPAGDALRVIQA
ncbi:MAG: tRNA (adenosine(37)-N6)-dimethylallyltransferase MiaA [Flavobacteriales bacterium]|nr:tRNA (adenosine(37)-N6)-dimethylallyltransferase MiaA [Flavobacteriales bacterium]